MDFNSDFDIDIRQFIKKIAKKVISFFIAVRFYILTGFLISITYNLYVFFTSDELYKSTLIGSSTLISPEEFKPTLFKINRFIKDNEKGELAKILGIDSADAVKIISLDFKLLSIGTKENTKERLELTLITTDIDIVDTLNKVVPNLFLGNEFVSKEAELAFYANTEIYNKITYEIKILDSLQIKQGAGASKSAATIISEPSAISDAKIKLIKQKMELYKILNSRQDFRVIEPFIKYKKPINKDKTWLTNEILSNFVLVASISVGFYLLFNLIIYIRKLISE